MQVVAGLWRNAKSDFHFVRNARVSYTEIMKPQILLVQHTDGTAPGHVLPWLKSRHPTYRHVRLQDGDLLPPPEQVQAVILCGGGVHVDQEDRYPWLRPEKKFIEACIAQNKQIVGLCLGGQLLAQILGARVYPHPQGWEVGWHDVTLQKVQTLAEFESSATVKFSQFHRYVFDLPPGAEILAQNSWWEVQAFHWKQQLLAFQFHPERDSVGNQVSANDSDLPTVGQTPSKGLFRLSWSEIGETLPMASTQMAAL